MELYEEMRQTESIFHGNSSGLDILSVLKGGLNIFIRNKDKNKVFHIFIH